MTVFSNSGTVQFYKIFGENLDFPSERVILSNFLFIGTTENISLFLYPEIFYRITHYTV